MVFFWVDQLGISIHTIHCEITGFLIFAIIIIRAKVKWSEREIQFPNLVRIGDEQEALYLKN